MTTFPTRTCPRYDVPDVISNHLNYFPEHAQIVFPGEGIVILPNNGEKITDRNLIKLLHLQAADVDSLDRPKGQEKIQCVLRDNDDFTRKEFLSLSHDQFRLMMWLINEEWLDADIEDTDYRYIEI